MTPPPTHAPPPAVNLTRRGFAAIFAALLVAAYPTAIFGARTFFYRDFGVLAYPTVAFAREAFWHGTLPLWNPLSHCGVPFLAQWGTMPLYPGASIYLLLPLPWSLNCFCLAHLWLAGLGMYCLARDWTRHDLAAAVAAVAFAFNGVTQSCLLWPNYTAALGWMPWVVWLAGKAARNGGRMVVVAAAVGALQLLTGVPEIAGLTWLLAVALAFGGGVEPRRTADASADPSAETNQAGWRVPFKASTACRWLGRLLLVFLLVLGLCAAQLLPFFDLLAHSQRAASGGPEKWALPGWGWANFLVPLFRCHETVQGTWFQPGQEFFGSVYLGVGLIGLALCGLTLARGRRVWLLAGLAGLGIALALGEASPVYRGLRALCPPLAMVRYPVKFVLLPGFAVPLLAALAVDAWQAKRLTPATQTWLRLPGLAFGLVLPVLGAVAGVCLVAGGVRSVVPVLWTNTALRLALAFAFWVACGWRLAARGRLRANLAALAALGFLVLDYRTHLPNLTPTLPAALLAPGLPGLNDLPRPGQGRVFITPAAEAQLLHSRVADFAQDYLGKRLALWSNLNLLAGVAKVNGAATLRLREQAELESALYAATNAADLPLLDFLGVTRQSSSANVTEWLPRPGALPLVTAGAEIRFVDPTNAVATLLRPDFDPRRTVILSSAERASVGATPRTEATVSEVQFGAGRVEFTVTSAGPTLAVVAQTYAPDWQARLDGARVRLLRANHAFQAVAVPPGRHRVILRYVDRRFQLGLAISGIALLAAATVWWRAGARP